MALYMYQASYTPESLAAQIKDPQDRLQVVGRQIESSGVKFVSGGFTYFTIRPNTEFIPK